MDNLKSNVEGLRELALFAGGGGGILGGKLLGWRTVCAVEIEEYARGILVRRQNEGHLEPFPIWSDVRTFDGRPWRGRVDVVSGGFPCQDISSAGKGAGIEGARSGLWGEMARIIGEVGPRYVWVENSPLLVSRGLALVLSDLASMGYDARWGVLGADDAGAPHRRKRIWVLAHADRKRNFKRGSFANDKEQGSQGRTNERRGATHDTRKDQTFGNVEYCNVHGQPTHSKRRGPKEKLREKQTRQDETQYSSRASSLSVSKENVAHSDGLRQQRQGCTFGPINPKANPERKTNISIQFSNREERWWDSEPALGRVAYGVADRMDRLKCLGNGQVPKVVELAWKTLINLD